VVRIDPRMPGAACAPDDDWAEYRRSASENQPRNEAGEPCEQERDVHEQLRVNDPLGPALDAVGEFEAKSLPVKCHVCKHRDGQSGGGKAVNVHLRELAQPKSHSCESARPHVKAGEQHEPSAKRPNSDNQGFRAQARHPHHGV
jgi:hypothetical protein